MLIIEQTAKGYRVQAKEPGLGRGFTAQAKDLKGVRLAVNHYFGAHHSAPTFGCPFCELWAHEAVARK